MKSCKRSFALLLSLLMIISLFTGIIPAYADQDIAGGNNEAHTHIFGAFEGYVDCVNGGTQTATCSICGATTTKTVPGPGHSFEYDDIAPTCTTTGTRYITCSRCQYYTEQTLPATGHNMVERVLLAPTCTEAGSGIRECANHCQTYEEYTIPATGHAWQKTVYKAATCTESGTFSYYCPNCGTEEFRAEAALGHNWGEWTVIQEASEAVEGLREHQCSRCKTVEQEKIPAVMPSALVPTPAPAGGMGGIGGDQEEYELTVVKSVLNKPAEGDMFKENEIVRFQIAVTYTGQQSLKAMMFDDMFSSGMLCTVNFDRGTPYGNQKDEHTEPMTQYMYFDYAVSAADVKRGYIENVARVQAPDRVVSSNTVHINLSQSTPTYSLAVTQQIINNNSFHAFQPGETIQIRIKVTNNGNGPVSNITLSDTLHTSPLQSGFALDAGKSTEITSTYVVPENVGMEYKQQTIALASGTGKNGVPANAASNTIEFIVKASEKLPTVTKTITTSPANGVYYVEGETIGYSIKVENTTDETISGIRVYDEMFGGLVDDLGSLEKGYAANTAGIYTVTAEDVKAGKIDNQASIECVLSSGKKVTVTSNTASALAGVMDQVSVVKTVTSKPANGVYYTVGETITYKLSVVNEGSSDITGLVIVDTLNGTSDVSASPLAPKCSISIETSHVVTLGEAMKGKLKNSCAAGYTDASGAAHTAVSNTVLVRTGIKFKMPSLPLKPGIGSSLKVEDPDPVLPISPDFPGKKDPVLVPGTEKAEEELPAVAIMKAVLSSPANGSFYTLGETISYLIQVENIGNKDIKTFMVLDTLSDTPNQWLKNGSNLTVGTVAQVEFSYVVKQSDVDRGYVQNSAIVKGWTEEKVQVTASSAAVTSPTGEKVFRLPDFTLAPPNPPFDFGFTVIPNPPMNVVITPSPVPSNPQTPVAETYCKRTIVPVSSDELGYIIENCSAHTAIDQAVLNSVQSAADEEALFNAWMDAQDTWKAEIDKLFAELADSAQDPVSRTIVISARVAYESQMETFTELCLQMCGSDPVKGAELIANEYKKFCTDLCALMHNKSNAVAAAGSAPNKVLGTDDCGVAMDYVQAGKEYMTLAFCPIYDPSASAVRLAMAGSAEVSWDHTADLWDTAYSGIMSKLLDQYTDNEKNVVLADMVSYNAWTESWESLIRLFDSEKDLSSRLMTRAYMDRTVTLCSISPVFAEVNKSLARSLAAYKTASAAPAATAAPTAAPAPVQPVPTIQPIPTPAPATGIAGALGGNRMLILAGAAILFVLIIVIGILIAAASAKRRRRRRRKQR